MPELHAEPFIHIASVRAAVGEDRCTLPAPTSFGTVHPQPEPFLSRVWEKPLLDAYMASVRRWNDIMFGPEEKRRRGHAVVTPYTDAELTDRAAAIAQWHALTADLEARGYLEHDHCYECGGELVPVTETEHRDWVWDETTDEWRERINEGTGSDHG